MTMTRRRGPTCRRSARRGPAAPPSGVIRVRPDAPLPRRPLLLSRLRPRAVPRAPALRVAVPSALVALEGRGTRPGQAGIAAPACVLTVPACVPTALGFPDRRGATGVRLPRSAPVAPSAPAVPSAPAMRSGRAALSGPAAPGVQTVPSRPAPSGRQGHGRRAGFPVRARPSRCRSGLSGRKPRPAARRTCRPPGPVSRAIGMTVLEAGGRCGPRRAAGGGGS
jgi:hypothetical protein